MYVRSECGSNMDALYRSERSKQHIDSCFWYCSEKKNSKGKWSYKPNVSFCQPSFSVMSSTRVQKCTKKRVFVWIFPVTNTFSRLFRYHMNAPSHQPQEKRWGVIYRHPTSWKLNDFLHWTYFHRSRRKCRSSWTERIIQQQACGDDGRDLTARLGRWESVLHSWHSKKPEKLEILRIWVRRWQSCGALK